MDSEYFITKNGYSYFFRIDGDTWAEQIFDEHMRYEIEQITNFPMVFDFPPEIVSMIVVECFWILATSNNFEEAFKLCRLSRSLARDIYKTIYSTNVSTSEPTIAVGHLLGMCKILVEDYLQMENPYNARTSIALNLETTQCMHESAVPFLRPWDFELERVRPVGINGQMSIAENGREQRYDIWKTGSTMGELVWTRGAKTDGTYLCKKLLYPVFHFIMISNTQSLLPSKLGLRFPWWQEFGDFLKAVFGPTTGVLFMVRRPQDFGNLFLSTSDLVLLFE